jgi:hypothetical protein
MTERKSMSKVSRRQRFTSVSNATPANSYELPKLLEEGSSINARGSGESGRVDAKNLN